MKFPNEVLELGLLESARKLFGQKLRAARLAKGLTQAQVGELIDRTSNSIALIERGERAPEWAAMEAIFSNLGEPPSFYFSNDRPSAPYQPTDSELVELLAKRLKTEPPKAVIEKQEKPTLEETLLAMFRLLPPERQHDVLGFIKDENRDIRAIKEIALPDIPSQSDKTG